MTTCCFTGHRPDKLGGYDWYSRTNIEIGKMLRKSILDLIDKGVDTFIFGGAIGIDQMAFAVTNKLKKEKGLDVTLVVAAPFKNQFVKWGKEDRDRYFSQLNETDVVIYCDELPGTKYFCELSGLGNYHPIKMQKRNEYMVDNSDYVVAVWDGTKGGTHNCFMYAQKNSKTIIRLNPREL